MCTLSCFSSYLGINFERIILLVQGETDPCAIPKSMGIFQIIQSPKNITSASVAKRIIDNLEAYKVCSITYLFLVALS